MHHVFGVRVSDRVSHLPQQFEPSANVELRAILQ